MIRIHRTFRVPRTLAAFALAVSALVVQSGVSLIDSAVASATTLGNCATSGFPTDYFPYGPDDPGVFGKNFNISSFPSGWWRDPTSAPYDVYNDYTSGPHNGQVLTYHDGSNVSFPSSSYLSETNSADSDGYSVDMALFGESRLLGLSSTVGSGTGDDALVAFCARFSTDSHINTAFVFGQQNASPWPPEIDIAEGAGGNVRVNVHWPGTNYNDNASTACSAGDNCSANYPNFTFPTGQNAADWNEYAMQWVSGTMTFWVDTTQQYTVTNSSCPTYAANGTLTYSSGVTEPCVPNSTGNNYPNNWQWSMQQNEFNNTLVTGSQHSDLAWFGDYVYQQCPPSCA
jgi:hypothetical protein